MQLKFHVLKIETNSCYLYYSMLKKVLSFACLLLVQQFSYAQLCTALGQNPSTAFPVCGVDTFSQSTVPYCGNRLIPTPCTDQVPYSDKNPFWYKFTCFTSGSLAFVIRPNDLNDDYDWQIFDVTNRNSDDVYTDASLFVACNWSAVPGSTGASASGRSLINCAGFTYPNFSAMPQLQQQHNYIMLISHFTDAPNGYKLSFSGGTASITDTTQPHLQSANATCDGTSVSLLLNKRMKCISLAANGSDFSIAPANANIKSVEGVGCSNSFDLDSVKIDFDAALSPGNYTLKIQNGTDENTLLDNCDKNITPGDSVTFIVYAVQPTPMDSLEPVLCAPAELNLVFRNNMRCNSIAADGSDFSVTGTSPVTITGAEGDCINGLTNVIHVRLNQPIQSSGSYTITLKTGNDGNTLLNECAQETPAGDALFFTTADTVSALFNYHVGLGCVYDTLVYAHDGRNNVNEWSWMLDSDGISKAQDSLFLFTTYGAKNIQLAVSNGVCSDTASVNILLDNELKALFSTKPSLELCPEDAAVFTDTSIGKIVSWLWLFGDGTMSTVQNPAPKNYAPAPNSNGRIYLVSLIIQNNIGCFDTAITQLKVLYTCYIAVPTAFTPNGDGLNDYLYPVNGYKANNVEFRIYNRLGQVIFETRDWTNKWDGKIKGLLQPAGVYVWTLNFINSDTQKKYALKGTTVLIR